MPINLQLTGERLVMRMSKIDELQSLVNRFDVSLAYYKDNKNAYNEHSCHIEYIDPLLGLLGWDVANKKGFFDIQ